MLLMRRRFCGINWFKSISQDNFYLILLLLQETKVHMEVLLPNGFASQYLITDAKRYLSVITN